jgi:hypothetical protein
MSTPLKTNPIYKVNHLVDSNVIDSIYVFYGDNLDIDNPTDLFKREPKNIAFMDKNTGKPIFNDEELKNITDKQIPVYFLDEQIHFDDSIGVVKIKIIEAFSKAFSMEEMYLFCLQEERLNPINVYQILTQNGRLPLTKIRLDQFLLNIVRDENGNHSEFNIPDKEVYEYDDILSLNLTEKKYWISKVLGQKFFIISNEYPYICNPYDVNEYDEFIERASRKSLTTLNSHLLLNAGDIIGNNIYLCLAGNVLKQVTKKQISEKYTINLYYPFLQRKNIISLADLVDKKETLKDGNDKLFTETTTSNFKSVNLFYDIYKERTDDLKYINRGIKYIKIVMHPTYTIKIPLDVIFKLIHATEDSPLIKYNPASRQENVYRLYANKIAKDGRKIPFLPKIELFKLMKNIGKSKSVALQVDHIIDEKTYSLVCEFEENGNIFITSDFENILSFNEINKIFKDTINPIIENVKNYLEQNGYKIDLFESLFDENVEIKQITYQTLIEINKDINIDSISGCLSSLFVIETKDLNKGISMRYKRVSNFNKVTSSEAFVIEKQKQKSSLDEIIKGLVENFAMTEKEARELVSKMINELQVERGVKKNEIEIKINPGFKTTIQLNKITGVITFQIENIDDINYLSVIPVYMDSIIRLTQNKSSTKVPLAIVNSICSSGEKEDIIIDDIISPTEVSLDQQEYPVIEGDELDYTNLKKFSQSYSSDDEENKPKNVLDLFMDEDEEEEEFENNSEEMGGGINSTSESDDSLPEGVIEGLDVLESLSDASSKKTSTPSPLPIAVPVNAKKKKPVTLKIVEKQPDKPAENTMKNIDGMKLGNPYYFQDRLENRDPTLFLKEEQGKFLSYSRLCSSTRRRQPVILNDEELNKIKTEKPGFLKDEDIIKYGSKPDNQFYYICPRYWCLKTNMPIDPSELKDVKDEKGNIVKMHPTCGKVIPRGEKVVPHGAYVYEFFHPAQHGSQEDDKYKKHIPGFSKEGTHPNDLCIPCCFSMKENQPSFVTRRDKCIKSMEEPVKGNKKVTAIVDAVVPEKAPTKVTEKDNYVKGPEKFPLENGRWGYLPTNIQMLLKEINADCQISKTNTNIKPNHTCLLRHGVEHSQTQSFIACIADARFYGEPKIPSISEMKQKIINSLDIDSFITFQNGNLITSFSKEEKDKDIDEKYKTSKLYSKLEKNNALDQFKQVIGAFENFIEYLKDDTIVIDYTYLWDIICKPNQNIFLQGINLVILEITNNDNTNNVEIICPTNQYSGEFYDARKQTLILLKNENYFEPIYAYRDQIKSLKVTKTFTEYDPHLSNAMRSVFKKIIKPIIRNTCLPLASMPNIYKFKKPILIDVLIEILNSINYKIIKQVINYNYKVIGIVVENTSGKKGVIPCYPSSLNSKYTYVFMNEDEIYSSYENTTSFLKRTYIDSKTRIPCNPAFKVLEDEVIIGVLTDTNQFIQLSDPKPISMISDNIEVLRDTNYIVSKDAKPLVSSDTYISNTNDVDVQREEYIKKIKLETNFYAVFRNTIRILLNKYENIKIREKIEDLVNLGYELYNKKLTTISEYLKVLVKDSIIFSDDYNYNLINEISTCIINSPEKCSSKKPLCAITDDNVCQLVLPKKNLLTGENNELHYYDKMTDELIRYNRIKSFIFQPQSYLSFSNLGYNLNDNEIIVIQSMLTSEYLDGLVEEKVNKYVRYNNYDNVEPIISQPYDNDFFVDENEKENQPRECTTTIENISSGVWKTCFPDKFKELVYDKSVICGYYLLIDIIKTHSKSALSIEGIKLELLDAYNQYLEKYEKQIIDVLISEGKKSLGDKVKNNTLTFRNLIYSDEYFITNLDIWVLLKKYNIPSILISSKNILQTNNTKNIFVCNGETSDNFVFIVCPAMRLENIAKYKIIVNEEKNTFFPINTLTNEGCVSTIRGEIESKTTIEAFLQSFVKAKAPKKIVKKLVLKQDEGQEQYNEAEEQPLQLKEKQKTKVVLGKQTKKRKPKLIIQEDL